ncbi:MAG TPA: hypothetical protein VJK06_02990 [Methyloceanibacter sp.]|nr:hypothetical protein [Methyloceanibacter sp.]
MSYIVSTQANGMVAVTTPAPNFMAAVTHGGFGRIPDAEPDPARQATETRQIETMVAAGYSGDFSSRYMSALVRGGENDAGGLDLIRQRHLAGDLHHGICDFTALPRDRFFRDAWRLDPMRGAIYVDLAEAKLVFARALIAAKADAVTRLVRDTEIATLAGGNSGGLDVAFRQLKEMDLGGLAAKMARAETPEALKALWPENLPGV